MSFITKIEQMRLASSISVSNTLANWQPYIEDAEETFIVPIIGSTLYSMLIGISAAMDARVPPGPYAPPAPAITADEEVYEALVLKLRKAVSLYALFLGIDEMSVSISPTGVQVIQSDTHKVAPQYLQMNLKETYLTRAHKHVDLALKIIYSNIPSFYIVDTKDWLPPRPESLVKDAEQFQLYADIHSSRRVFLSLLPIMVSIEKKYISPTLSPELYHDIKTKVQSGETLSSDDQVLHDMIIPGLVHLTMARALLEISIDILDWGIFNNAANTFNGVQGKTLANQEARISVMNVANQRDGESELKMLQEFLDNTAGADKYALYFASSRYFGPLNASQRGEFINTVDKSFFVC